MRLNSVARYWHTLRYLKPVQFYRRAWFRLYSPPLELNPIPALRQREKRFIPPAQRLQSLIGPGEFTFLGVNGCLSGDGWNSLTREKLWRYNQHYFDDLNAEDSSSRRQWHLELLHKWVEDNLPGQGCGWEPYPTSLRIVNWVKWALLGNNLPEVCIGSLAIQARWLRRRLEYHLSGNHLFANAKALVFAGLYFDGKQAEGWLAKGLSILAREIPEQILGDGGHFERSTMYHALALEDLLDLLNICELFQRNGVVGLDELSGVCRARIPSMLTWLDTMCHPDGDIAFFNDAAFDIAPSPGRLFAYAKRLGFDVASPGRGCSRWLGESGYARLQEGEAVALIDLAPIGPDYLPGHAHADTLSFELSLFGQRVLVNSGSSMYGVSEERLRQRGTGAHNTVAIDEYDSSEVWGGFRVARRARPLAVSVNLESNPLAASGSHDGYTRLPGKPVHRRRWQMTSANLVVVDEVSDPAANATARFYFHPAVKPKFDPVSGKGYAEVPGGHQVSWQIDVGEGALLPATWHPRFGSSEDNWCLAVHLKCGSSKVVFQWM